MEWVSLSKVFSSCHPRRRAATAPGKLAKMPPGNWMRLRRASPLRPRRTFFLLHLVCAHPKLYYYRVFYFFLVDIFNRRLQSSNLCIAKNRIPMLWYFSSSWNDFLHSLLDTTFSTDSNGSIHFNIAMIFKEREVVEVWCWAVHGALSFGHLSLSEYYSYIEMNAPIGISGKSCI